MEVIGCKLLLQFANYGLTSRPLHTLKPLASWRWAPGSLPLSSSSLSSSVGRRRERPFLTTASSASSSDTAEAGNAANPFDDSSLMVKNAAAEISPVLKGTSVFLVGMNCSIKSNVGKLLADALRYYYFDSDRLVEEATGIKSSTRLLIDNDDEAFRESETEVLKQLSSMGRLIVCAGNGAVSSMSNLALLRHGISIWIDVPLDMVAREVSEEENFIQLSSKSSESTISKSSYLEVLTQLYEQSKTGYAAADSTVSLLRIASKLGYRDLAEVTVEDVALEVLKELQKLTRVKKMMEAAARPF